VLTDAAAGKVKALLDQEGRDDLALRVAVQPGGCSGLRYQLFFDERSLAGDVVKDFDGVQVCTASMSAPSLRGPPLDFADTSATPATSRASPSTTRTPPAPAPAATPSADPPGSRAAGPGPPGTVYDEGGGPPVEGAAAFVRSRPSVPASAGLLGRRRKPRAVLPQRHGLAVLVHDPAVAERRVEAHRLLVLPGDQDADLARPRLLGDGDRHLA